MKKFYPQNVLDNENFVAKRNFVWSAEITNFKLNEKKVYIYFKL